MRKNTNTQGFTLVELIIVITILAILATIAFISFQGYSKEAKNSGRMSEISNVVKEIAIRETRDSNFEIYNIATGQSALAGRGNTATGKLNTSYLGLNSKNSFDVGILGDTYYLIATELESVDVMPAQTYSSGADVGILEKNKKYFISGNAFFDGATGNVSITETCILSGTLLVGSASGKDCTTTGTGKTFTNSGVALSDFFK